MSSAERKSIDNGIWMCRTHAKLIDSDEATYTVAQLHEWKRQAEAEAERRLRTGAARAGAGTLPPIWNVPHLQNPHFTGRDELLRQLYDTLTSGRSAALTQTLRGLGGVGKTQTALEYAYRHSAEYKLVWWVAAEEPATLNQDLADLAVELELVEPEARDQAAAVDAARRWLEGNAGWLLVFDNAEEPEALRAVLPRGGAGQVIITSRRTDWGHLGTLAVEPFDRDDSVRFLEACDAGGEAGAADELAELLGDLPLALEQAAAYRSETGLSTARYLELFRRRRRDLLARGVPEDHDAVATTWDLSFEALEAASAPAAALLRVCAFLAPEDIPRVIFRQTGKIPWWRRFSQWLFGVGLDLPVHLSAITDDSVALLDAVAAARRFSLLEADDDAISMHRLVQAITRDRCDPDERRRWSRAAVALLDAAYRYDENDLATWELAGRLLPHVRAAVDRLDGVNASKPAARLLNETGRYLLHRGVLAEARRHLEQSLEIDEAVYGKDHPNVAIRANNIGQILQAQGDLDGALVHARRALEIDEAVHGKDHPNVGTRANNIATILKDQGDLDGALVHARRALEIGEAVHGKDHRKVAIRANNIATILQAQGDLDGALVHARRALEIDEAVYGKDHPKVAIRANNIGLILQAQGDLDGALVHARRALEIDEAVYGKDHPEVAIRANNIGGILQAQGDLDGAREQIGRALAIFERVYGPDHPSTVIARKNLAAIPDATE